jgi:hypothetical protein
MEGGMDREKLKALAGAALGTQGPGGFPQGGEPSEPGYGGDAEGYGKPGFPALPGHEPAVGHRRKTCKNHDLIVGVII